MEVLHDIVQGCVSCNICTKECSFLEKHGTPGSLCESYLAKEHHEDSPVFECNLCRLCETVCPKEMECSTAFLEIRKNIQKNGHSSSPPTSIHKEHNTLCAYEARGTSSTFSLHLFPDGCESVFFPGCTLTATRSETTQATYEHLKTIDFTMGIVLDCCTKPSHDLGLDEKFQESFAELCDLLKANNINKIITACPSCYITFSTYGPEFETFTVYEILATSNLANPKSIAEKFSIHDTCATRYVTEIHDSVRILARGAGAELSEMKHSRSTAICCGEGGAASFMAPELANGWKDIREEEAAGRRIITYCAGCSTLLGKELPTTHLLDLLFDPQRAINGKERVAKAPFTYLNRLRLKYRLKRADRAASIGKRPSVAPKKRLALVLILLVVLVPLFYLNFSL